MRRLIGSGWVEEIEVHADDPDQIQAAVDAGRLAGRRVKVAGSTELFEPARATAGERWTAGDRAWLLIPTKRSKVEMAVKRLIDAAVAAALLLLLSPALIAIAVAVKITSDGPIFYPWRVLGEFGRPFVGYKFRTMVRNADDLKPSLLHLNERSGPVFKMANDPRVTPLGRWLRKHSLDELPQLWSALVGDMSLVGPRPPSPDEYRNFELWQMRKLSVKPGMTCVWQVEGRSTMSEFSDWARLDLQYIDNWSLWKDFEILMKTALVVVKGTGS
jgi:lipopolysaccharide/colanic/teichoic acid biosynthesis glycosyltransferase